MTRSDRGPGDEQELRTRVSAYLHAHHTMSLATVSRAGNAPYAASVFYAVDDDLRMVFLSKTTSVHATHIGREAPVAVTVSEDYADWEAIQGVQLWGQARLLAGTAKATAMALYVRRFPFVRDLLAHPRYVELVRDLGVYRVEPTRVALTDNRTGAFGREVLELEAR